MQVAKSRRDFLTTLSAVGAATAFGARASLADEGPPETTTIRLAKTTSICIAPGQIADALLRAEGFNEIRYLPYIPVDAVARGELDFGFESAAWLVSHVDAGDPVMVLAGVHAGCFELFAHEPIRTVSDLKGRRVGIPQKLGSAGHLYLALMAAQVGLDPHKDINWVRSSAVKPMELFVEGKIDAFLAFPPQPQELRASKVGRVILNTTTDKPWSQYFCCMTFGNKEFVRGYPVATKRFLRAVLKAIDLCAAEPAWAAQRLVEGGFTERYDYALQTLTELPYASWREFDPEDSLRFYALRLHEVGMIKSSPKTLLAEGTDWRFVNELKRELKA